MGRPRKAVDAAVLAAAIGIDRAIEGDVRRVVVGDDPARGIDRKGGGEARRLLLGRAPTVVHRLALRRLVASVPIADGAAYLPRAAGERLFPQVFDLARMVRKIIRTLKGDLSHSDAS